MKQTGSRMLCSWVHLQSQSQSQAACEVRQECQEEPICKQVEKEENHNNFITILLRFVFNFFVMLVCLVSIYSQKIECHLCSMLAHLQPTSLVPRQVFTCHLKRYHFERKNSLEPTSIVQGIHGTIVYLPTCTIKNEPFMQVKYTCPMDPMGYDML